MFFFVSKWMGLWWFFLAVSFQTQTCTVVRQWCTKRLYRPFWPYVCQMVWFLRSICIFRRWVALRERFWHWWHLLVLVFVRCIVLRIVMYVDHRKKVLVFVFDMVWRVVHVLYWCPSFAVQSIERFRVFERCCQCLPRSFLKRSLLRLHVWSFLC